MATVAARLLKEGRRSYSESSGGGGQRSLTDKVSGPIPTAIDEVPPQSVETITTGPGSSSSRDKQQVQQQKQHQPWNSSGGTGDHGDQGDQNSRHHHSSGRAGGAGDDPVVSPTVSAPLQSTLLATEWMETEWKPFALPRGGTRTAAENVSGSRLMSTTTGMRPIHPSPVFSDDNSIPLRMVGAKLLGDATTTIAADRAAPSSPPTERWREEFANDRMCGRGGGGSERTGACAYDGGGSSAIPTVSGALKVSRKT